LRHRAIHKLAASVGRLSSSACFLPPRFWLYGNFRRSDSEGLVFYHPRAQLQLCSARYPNHGGTSHVLPLAAVMAGSVLALWSYASRYPLFISPVSSCDFTSLTWQRNQDYKSAQSIWADNARKAPENYRAHYNLGNAFAASGHSAETASSYETAIKLDPAPGSIQHNLAVIPSQLGRSPKATPITKRPPGLNPKPPTSGLILR
jgi:tetratricopeptide (TPR) repeat protein